MRIKRVFAGALSLMLAITMMPVTVFAASTNSVNTALQVSKDATIPESYIDFEVRSGTTWTSVQKISLTIENAEFANDPDAIKADGSAVTAGGEELIKISYDDDKAGDGASVARITAVSNADEDSLDLTITTYEDSTFTTEAVPQTRDSIVLTFVAGSLKADKKAGTNVTVTVDLIESNITAGTYVLAHIAEPGSTVSIKGTVSTYTYNETFEGAQLQIKERTVNTLSKDSVHVLRLTLPKNVKFTGEYLTEISGSMFKTTELTNSVPSSTSYEEMTQDPGCYYLDKDNSVLYVAVKVSGKNDATETGYITPMVTIGKDATKGAITISLKDVYASEGYRLTDASSMQVGKYGTEGVTITSSKTLPEIVSGQIRDLNEDFFWTEIRIKENMTGTLTAGREISIDLPEDVQIVSRAINHSAGIRVNMDKDKDLDNAPGSRAIDVDGVDGLASEVSTTVNGEHVYMTVEYDDGPTLANDTSGFSTQVPTEDMDAVKTWESDSANTLIIFIPVTVKVGFTGDIKAKITCKDFEATELVIGKVVSPVTMTTGVTDVVNGAQDQKTATITIKENVAGYVGKNNNADAITLKLDCKGIANGFTFKNAVVKATAGDLSIKDDVTINNDQSLTINTVGTSIYPATIEISGITVNTARNLPEGAYNLGILVGNEYRGCAEQGKVEKTDVLSAPTNDAIVENAQFDNGAFGVEKDVYIDSTPYLNNLTAADTSQSGIVAQFDLSGTAGTKYTVNGTTYEMDAAAYIDENNRTMVPIRYVAYALGLKDADISYDVGSTTATLSGLSNVVRVTTGSNVLRCSNTSNITMDTVAANVSGRLYVPARFIAQSLGAQVSWNQDTQTVTITA